MEDTLGIFNGYVMHNDEEYDDFDMLMDKIGEKLNLILFDKSILIKIYEFKKNPRNLISEINNRIQNDIPVQDDILIDYIYDKSNKKLFIYYMSGGGIVDRLCNNANKLEVSPVQFIIKEYVHKKIKKTNRYMIIAKIKNQIYIIRVYANNIVRADISNEFSEIVNIIKDTDKEELVIIDTKLAEFIDESINFSLNYMTIGENIYDGLFKKKKLSTKQLFTKKKLKLQR